jgi:Pentapeptide repeats (8 copies)
MDPITGDTSNELWYLRRGAEIRGPFPWTVIVRNAGLGRIHPTDQLSCDRDSWLAPDDIWPRLLAPPSLVGSAHDERRAQRRDTHSEVGVEQHQCADRRVAEDPHIVERRVRSERVWAGLQRSSGASIRMPLLAIGLALSVSLALAMHPSPTTQALTPDCRAPAASKVNWDFCTKPKQQLAREDLAGMSARNAQLHGADLTNTNLRGADFAYADLSATDFTLADGQRMRLVGASLRKAIFNHARLTGADLRFADLSGASLAGTELSATRLGNAIWIDGRVCAQDSIGVCNTQ